MTKSAVRVAVEPLLIDAIAKAEEAAKEDVKKVEEKLVEFGWDIKKAFPYPKDAWARDYKALVNLYHFAQSLTVCDEEKQEGHYRYNPGAPAFRKLCSDRVAHYVELSKKMAADQYEMFIMKLEHKIGPHDTALLEGNHVWSESFLTITKKDETEVWKTQGIYNRSKFGRWFPQWPTRKVKNKR